MGSCSSTPPSLPALMPHPFPFFRLTPTWMPPFLALVLLEERRERLEECATVRKRCVKEKEKSRLLINSKCTANGAFFPFLNNSSK